MARVLDVSDCPTVPLWRVAHSRRAFCKAVQFEAAGVVPHRPMMWETPGLPPEVVAAHVPDEADLAAPTHVHVFRDVAVGGYGSQPFRDGAYVTANDPYPHYVREFIAQEESRDYWEIAPRERVLTLNKAFVISHMNPMYGHWLLEIFLKLLAIRALMRRGLKAPVLLPSHIFGFVREAAQTVLPGVRIVEYNRVVETAFLRRAVLPGMMHQGYVFHPKFHELLDEFLRPYREARGPRAIFVSRSRLNDAYRRMDTAAELDDLARSLGLTVIHPEDCPWPEQVRLFASARLIVGEFGSGLHNALFAAAGAKVVALNAVNEIQSRIANARGHDVSYLLDHSRGPVRHRLRPDGQQSYVIDPEEFRHRVAPLVAASV